MSEMMVGRKAVSYTHLDVYKRQLQGLRRTALPLSKAVYLLQNGGEKLPVYGNTLLCELQARLRDGKRYVLQN